MGEQRRGEERDKQEGPSPRLPAGLDRRQVSRSCLCRRRKRAVGRGQRGCGQSQLPRPAEAACQWNGDLGRLPNRHQRQGQQTWKRQRASSSDSGCLRGLGASTERHWGVRHHHASRGLGPGDGSMRGTGSLCKDSPGHQQGRPLNGWVFSCPGGGRGMGNQNPSQIRPGATWVAKGSDIRKSPRLTQGSILLQSQAVRVVSVNGKQVPKSFLEETSLILVQGWPVEMQIHGHHPVNSGPPELAHSQVCPAIEAEVVWEPHREGP